MSTMFIISAIVLASVLTSIAFVIIGKIEHKSRKINLNWILLMMVIVLSCILCMVLIYHHQNDLTSADLQRTYEQGVEDGKASKAHTYPSNEEIEAWMTNTEEVVVSTHEDGSDPVIHIVDGNGEEWVLVADEVTNNG